MDSQGLTLSSCPWKPRSMSCHSGYRDEVPQTGHLPSRHLFLTVWEPGSRRPEARVPT
jgi:hypothetical protein